MAKKIVRGITDVKTINNQDFDTNNVNDLLSDGQYNYIHRKKGKIEEYHNLTDNIKTISSDNTELLAVTNNNKTTNTATLHPNHDAQKEQVLESTRNTITINHGANGTAEKTTVDTNPQKVLEHENLISDSEYITLDHQTDDATTHIQTAALKEKLDNLQQNKQDVLTAGTGITIEGQTVDTNPQKVLEHENLVSDSEYITLNHQTGENTTHIQTAKLKEKLDNLQQTKQDTLIAGSGITIQGQTISASGSGAPVEGASVSIQDFTPRTQDFGALKQVVTIGQQTLTTFVFVCFPGTAEIVLTGELKEQLEEFVYGSVSNGAISISNDGTTMKLINSKSSEEKGQQGTFTFYNPGGGGVQPE